LGALESICASIDSRDTVRDIARRVNYRTGTPKDIDAARDAAARDRFRFQWWAVSLVSAQPYGGNKKRADTGTDGNLFFKPDAKRTEVAMCRLSAAGSASI
jgi:hypothetical protein